MSDGQVAGAFLLLAIAAGLIVRWFNGRSPASLYRDELGPRPLTEAQQHEIRLAFRRPHTTTVNRSRGGNV
jgi:hypothetical protein